MEFLSCVPSVLYGSGGFFDSSDVLADLVATGGSNEAACRLVATLYEPFGYQRPMAEIHGADPAFKDGLEAHYRWCDQMFARGAASALVHLRSGVLQHSMVFVQTPSGLRTLYETYRQNDRPALQPADPAGQDADTASLTGTDAVNFFLGSAGSHNYGHWLVDDLPRTRAIQALRTEANGRPIRIWINAIGPAMDQVRSDSLTQLPPAMDGVEVRLLVPGRFYAFEGLYYATPVTYHPALKSPDAMRFVATTFRPPDAVARRRLFVTRREHAQRSLLNAPAIEALLSARGFETVDVEAMSFAEQVRTFSEAALVVGCMGAAMTNCVFAPEGTPTVYLAPAGWMEPFYWDLAAIRAHRYVVCFGQAAEGDAPVHMRSYAIDPAELERILDQVTPNPALPPG